jgi:hypothetical protein
MKTCQNFIVSGLLVYRAILYTRLITERKCVIDGKLGKDGRAALLVTEEKGHAGRHAS